MRTLGDVMNTTGITGLDLVAGDVIVWPNGYVTRIGELVRETTKQRRFSVTNYDESGNVRFTEQRAFGKGTRYSVRRSV